MLNKQIVTRFLILINALFLMGACTKAKDKGIQSFDLEKIVANYPNSTRVANSKIFTQKTLKISSSDGHNGIVIWTKEDKQIWSEGKYLVFEIYGENDFSGVVNIEFYKEVKDSESEKIVLQSGEVSGSEQERPWISSLMGILPRLKTKVVFPLSFLDAQTLFVPRSPRQLKGTVSGNRLDPNDIVKVVLRFGPYFPPYFLPEYEIASISINDSIPEPYPTIEKPIVDKFGQWILKEWDGKVQDEKDLIKKNLDLEESVASASYPEEWSRFGGWKLKRFNSTGFFRTQHDGKRWWLVDPDGYAFLSTGVDCIRYGSGGPVDGIEDLFEWIPSGDDSDFSEAISLGKNHKSMDFFVANMIRVYGKNWKNKWNSLTAGLMKKLRFNSVGNWSDIEFAKKNQIPYVLPMRGFPETKIQIYRDFPDVFAEEYQKNSEKFASQLTIYKDDPYMVGYFLRNEPNWAFGYHNLAYEMFATNQQSKTKNEFVRWIIEKYKNNLDELNRLWRLKLKSMDDLKSLTFKEYPSKTAYQDFYDFSMIMVKMYVDVPCNEVDKVDTNHLNLGMRYAWLSSDLLYKAGERFDVFSINGYGINPPPTKEISKISGKPVMIGEFHQGAVDRALPATGIIGVLTQDDRAKAYRNYIEQGFSRPELVGMHYFQWIDQPFYGRSDGENYNIGVVTTNNLPYPELMKAMTLTNERIYKIASEQIQPFAVDLVKIPPIHY